MQSNPSELGKIESFSQIELKDFESFNSNCVLYKHYVLNFQLTKSIKVFAYNLDTKFKQGTTFQARETRPEFLHAIYWKEDKIILLQASRQYKDFLMLDIVSVREDGDMLVLKTEEEIKTQNKPSIVTFDIAQLDGNNLFLVESFKGKIWRLDLETLIWETIAGPSGVPINIYNSCEVFYQNKIYLCGGKWTQLPAEVLSEFSDRPDNKWVISGANRSYFSSTVCIYHWEDKKWSQINFSSMALPFIKGDSTAIEINDRFYFLNNSLIWSLNPEDETLVKHSEVSGKLPSGNVRAAKYHNQILFWEPSLYTKRVFLVTVKVPEIENIPKESPTLLHMKKLFIEKNFTDIVFAVEGHDIAAHKCIVIKCKFFENMLFSGMVEATADRIPIPGISVACFKAILEFVYCDYVELDESLASELIIQADKYSLAGLKSLCEQALIRSLRMENVSALTHLAEQVDATGLENKIIEFVFKHCENLEKNTSLNDLPHSILLKALSASKS